MKYQELKEQLKDFVVFSLNDIRKIEPDFYRRRLNEWQIKGYIKKLRRGYYMFSDIPLDEKLFLLSPTSFTVHLMFHLRWRFLITVLFRRSLFYNIRFKQKTTRFKTPIAEFSYHSIKPALMFGYRLENQNGQKYKIAEMEKALLDYLYLNPHVAGKADFYEWRFNGKEFLANADMLKLNKYAEAFRNKRLMIRLKKIIGFMKYSK